MDFGFCTSPGTCEEMGCCEDKICMCKALRKMPDTLLSLSLLLLLLYSVENCTQFLFLCSSTIT